MAMRPAKLSKLNTVGQILFVGTTLGVKAFDLDIASLLRFGGVAVAALTLASMVVYILQWLRHFPDHKK
jgi:phosphatidylglycerophosphate synthase